MNDLRGGDEAPAQSDVIGSIFLNDVTKVDCALFDPSNSDPQFEIRVRAQRFSPDMFYVNEFASRLHTHDPAKFQKLFG